MAGNSLADTFSRLKDEISVEVCQQHISLQQVKDFFRGSIESDRSISRANNLDAIYRLLEERCLLSETNVTALYALGQHIRNNKIQKYVKVYCYFILKNSEPICNICGFSCNYEEVLDSHLGNHQSSDSNLVNNNDSDRVDELEEALKNVSINVGRYWKILARELDLDEKTIDDICNNNPNNLRNQAQSAFNIWRAMNPDATISKLDKALEMRVCKNKGLGIHLRKPVVSHTVLISNLVS